MFADCFFYIYSQTAGSDNSAKHSGNEESARNTQWSWKHLQLNAGDDDDHDEMQGWDDRSLQSVLDEATTAWGIKVERVEMWARISIIDCHRHQRYLHCHPHHNRDHHYNPTQNNRKDARLPVQLQRAMAAEAEAAREARAKVAMGIMILMVIVMIVMVMVRMAGMVIVVAWS